MGREEGVGKRERGIGGTSRARALIDYSLAATAINNVGKLRQEGDAASIIPRVHPLLSFVPFLPSSLLLRPPLPDR